MSLRKATENLSIKQTHGRFVEPSPEHSSGFVLEVKAWE